MDESSSSDVEDESVLSPTPPEQPYLVAASITPVKSVTPVDNDTSNKYLSHRFLRAQVLTNTHNHTDQCTHSRSRLPHRCHLGTSINSNMHDGCSRPAHEHFQATSAHSKQHSHSSKSAQRTHPSPSRKADQVRTTGKQSTGTSTGTSHSIAHF